MHCTVASKGHQIWGPVEPQLCGFTRVLIIAQKQGVGNQELSPSQEKGSLQLAWELGRVLMS